jgi:hypothetical protein
MAKRLKIGRSESQIRPQPPSLPVVNMHRLVAAPGNLTDRMTLEVFRACGAPLGTPVERIAAASSRMLPWCPWRSGGGLLIVFSPAVRTATAADVGVA